MRLATINALETICGWIDWLPAYRDGRWYRHGTLGCHPLGISTLALRLDRGPR